MLEAYSTLIIYCFMIMQHTFGKRIFFIHRRDLLLIFFTITAAIASVPIVTYAYFAKDLSSKERIMNRNDTGVILLDRHDKPFFTFFQAKYRSFVQINDIPLIAQQAVIASEDKGFYNHQGFSSVAILRSLAADILQQQIAYGGSTITQQLVKNTLLSSNKSILRKYQEIVLAQEIERRYSKQEILEMYLNSVYFGAGAFGIEEAAQTYFAKPASELTIAQSAFLAGLLPAPSELSPLTGDTSKAIEHQRIILEELYNQHYITRQQEQEAQQQPLAFNFSNSTMNTNALHFALLVKDELTKRYGEEQIARSGFRVHTTLDLTWQQFAEDAVKRQVANLAPDRVSNGAAVAIDPKTGEVLVLVGSVDWNAPGFGKVNVATSPRQPGSSFKPIVYVTGFDEGVITEATILNDAPTTFPINYRPKDYDRRYRGLVTVRRALANSLNIPSVEVLQKVGIPQALETGKELGLTTLQDPSSYGLSLVLGAAEVNLLEMTNVYATFADQGNHNPITLITEIDDKDNHAIYTYNPQPEHLLNPGDVFLISSILSDNQARAEEFGNTLTISRPAAVKTGTTEDFRDAWTLGYTPSLAVGAWVGNNDNTPMDNIAGSLGAAPIWKNLMEEYLKETPIETFSPPRDIIQARVCTGLGTLQASSSARLEYFKIGTQPLSCQTLSPTPFPSISLSSTPSLFFPSPTSSTSSTQRVHP